MCDIYNCISTHRGTRNDHLMGLQEMILMDQKSTDHSNHDNDEDNDGGEEPITLLGELCFAIYSVKHEFGL